MSPERKRIIIVLSAIIVAIIVIAPISYVIFVQGSRIHQTTVKTVRPTLINYAFVDNFMNISSEIPKFTPFITASTVFFNNVSSKSFLNLSVRIDGYGLGAGSNSVAFNYQFYVNGSTSTDLIPSEITIQVNCPNSNQAPFNNTVTIESILGHSKNFSSKPHGIGTFQLKNTSNIAEGQNYHFSEFDYGGTTGGYLMYNHNTLQLDFTVSLSYYTKPVTTSLDFYLTQIG